MQTYPCNSDGIFVTQERHFTATTFETDSYEAGSSDNDKDNTNTDRRHEDSATASESQVWPRPQDTSNSGGVHPFTTGPTSYKQGFYTNYCLSLFHGSDPAVSGREQ